MDETKIYELDQDHFDAQPVRQMRIDQLAQI